MKYFYLIVITIFLLSSCAQGSLGDRDGGPGTVNIDLGLGDTLDSLSGNNRRLSNACSTNFGVCQIAPNAIGSNCYCDAMTAVGPQRHFGRVR